MFVSILIYACLSVCLSVCLCVVLTAVTLSAANVCLSVCLSVCVCSIAESDSCDAESAPDDSDMSEVGMAVARFIIRFIDKVCTESNVRSDHIRALHQMIPGRLLFPISIFAASYRVLCTVLCKFRFYSLGHI